MERDDLIKLCRYYRGQERNPFSNGNNAWFWDMERVYVSHGGKFEGERETYLNRHFKKYADIPFDLLMVFFTSWGKQSYIDEESIKGFYRTIDLYLDKK